MRPAGVVVRSAKANGFIAGADIKEFLTIRTPEEGYAAGARRAERAADGSRICPARASPRCTASRWAAAWNSRWPARYRIGADDASLSLGLPEVLLGIHPGFGGTVRSRAAHRRAPGAGADAQGQALQGRARARGRVCSIELVPPAELTARAKRCCCEPPPRQERAVRREALEPRRGATVRRAADRRRPCGAACAREHYPAPYAIVDLWQRYGAVGAASYEAEARSIGELMCTPTSRNLVRVFLLQDRLKGLGGKSADRIPARACRSAPASWAATSRPGRRCAA